MSQYRITGFRFRILGSTLHWVF